MIMSCDKTRCNSEKTNGDSGFKWRKGWREYQCSTIVNYKSVSLRSFKHCVEGDASTTHWWINPHF